MSTDHHAMTVVGVRITPNSLYRKMHVPNCEHQHSHPFCPECGAKAGTTEVQRKIDGFSTENGAKLKGLKVVSPLHLSDYKGKERDKEHIVVGLVIGDTGSHQTGPRLVECKTDFNLHGLTVQVSDKLKGTPFERSFVSLYTVFVSYY